VALVIVGVALLVLDVYVLTMWALDKGNK